MFHPVDHPLERGWVGRVDGEHVVQLAAQTLQSFFTGGGSAREHAVYPLAGVKLLAPVLHPPAVRVFEDDATFAFANPAAIVGPGTSVGDARLRNGLLVLPRVAAVIGAEGALAGFTALAEWRAPGLAPPKDRDFALALGPVVLAGSNGPFQGAVRVDGKVVARLADGFDWEAARDLAALGTRLLPGDILAGPPLATASVPRGGTVEVEIEGLGTLATAAA